MRLGNKQAWGGIAMLGITSAFMPLSYDEGAWLAIGRRWTAGAALYHGVVDNKSPAVYALVRVLDILPGPYQIARGVFVAIFVAGSAMLGVQIASSLGVDMRRSRIVGAALGATVALQTVFVLTIELVAIALFLTALLKVIRGRALIGGFLLATACVFDPRFAILLPGLVMISQRDRPRLLLAFAIPAVIGSAMVLAQSELRSALIGLNLATRANVPWRPAVQFLDGIRALMIPAVGLVVIGATIRGRDRRRAAAWALFVPAVFVVFVSVRSFEPYWIIPAAALPVFAAGGEPRTIRSGAILLLLALIPAVVNVGVQFADHSPRVARYEEAAYALDRALGPNSKIVIFDQQPFMATFLPARWVGRSPILDVYVLDTALRDPARTALSRAIDEADVIVDDGVLAQPEANVFAELRPLWRLFHARLAEFGCTREVEEVTFRFRSRACPPV